MPTLNSWGNQVLTANVTLNGGTCDIGSDATSGAINIGTGAAARTTTIGNGTGATSVVVDCGTGALNLGANAIARTTTLGNTTGASVLALKFGTGDFTLASATGTVISALDTGEVTMPLKPAFSAHRSANVANVTGNFTYYQIVFDAEDFDQGADYNPATGVFTCPVTGVYYFNSIVQINGCTIAQGMVVKIIPSVGLTLVASLYRAAGSSQFVLGCSGFLSLAAGTTVTCGVATDGEAADTNDLVGAATLNTRFSGYLVC